MNPYALLGPLCGAAAVAGVCVLIGWLRGFDPSVSRARTRSSRVLGSGVSTERQRKARMIAISIVVGGIVWLLTKWPVGGIAAGAATYFLPFFFTVGTIASKRIAKLEALEEWVRRLADTMAAGGSSVSTIVASADRAPEAIRPEVRELASRLATARWDRGVALHLFANRIDDSLADLISYALEIAVTASSSDRVPAVLREVAEAASEEVKGRRQVEVERSAPRNEAKVLVGMVVATVVFLVTFTNFTVAYGTPVGQVFLAVLAALSAGALFMIRKYSLGEQTPRTLADTDHQSSSAAAAQSRKTCVNDSPWLKPGDF